MAQSGGYDLSDPFIDDGNLVSQTTAVNVSLHSWIDFIDS